MFEELKITLVFADVIINTHGFYLTITLTSKNDPEIQTASTLPTDDGHFNEQRIGEVLKFERARLLTLIRNNTP